MIRYYIDRIKYRSDRMTKNVGNNKGFTLIELLAVIVIMGILMIVAIPAVTKYINNSKKDTFFNTAGAYISSARYMLLNDEFTCQTPTSEAETVYVKITEIDLDNDKSRSPYNANFDEDSYVLIESDDRGKLKYSIVLRDTRNNGTVGLIRENELGRSKIKTGQTEVSPAPEGEECTKNS